MKTLHLTTFVTYFSFIVLIVLITLKKQKSEKDFVIGSRGLNFWLTALSAHASDMSQWLFLGYPMAIYLSGVFGIWTAIGLTVCMYFNWQFIAPKIRTITEQTNSLTLNTYFEKRFSDTSGIIRLASALMTFLFYTIYISSGLQAMGILVESLFGMSYVTGIIFGIILVTFYVFIGGYTTVAWVDLFQGMFLLGVLLFLPIYLLSDVGGMGVVMEKVGNLGLTTSLFPDYSMRTILSALAIAFGWGLGYLGQPHIITKFMGIKKVEDMNKSKIVGISWQALALGAASLVGLIGIYLFPEGLKDPSTLVISIAEAKLPTLFVGLVLCAILAATTNVIAAQILVVASSMSEDFYKKWIRRNAGGRELLHISRLSVIIIALLAFIIAYNKTSTIYELVLFAWSGIGASFGPLLLVSLYSKKINRHGAIAGIITGGVVTILWPLYFSKVAIIGQTPLLPAFGSSLIAIFVTSFLTKNKRTANET